MSSFITKFPKSLNIPLIMEPDFISAVKIAEHDELSHLYSIRMHNVVISARDYSIYVGVLKASTVPYI